MIEDIHWVSTHGKVQKEIIEHIEKRLGIPFPEDYKECARINHGGTPVPDTFDLEEYGEGVVNRLLSFNEDSPIYILNTWESLKTVHKQPKEIIPFANDPFGNIYCFDYRESESNPVIVFYDHETDPDDDMALTYVCDTFTELIESLHEGNS